MSWQKYYSVIYGHEVYDTKLLPSGHQEYTRPVWVIVFNENCAVPGKEAYHVYYRTERLAIRGAERLYKRTLGQMENLLGIT